MAEKTTGQWVGAVVGAVVGYFTGGAGYIAMGAALGSTAGGLIDPPKGPKLQGPRLSDLSGQTCSYGTVIPRVYSTVGLYGNLFWLENNQIREQSKTEGGGKGGGGGPTTTTYEYFGTFAIGLCQGPIEGVRRIWVGDELIYDAGSLDTATLIASNNGQQYWTLYTGSEDQLPDPRMQAALGVANTPAFRGVAYIVFKDYPLAKHGNSLLGAQVKVEVVCTPISDLTRFAGTTNPAYLPLSDNWPQNVHVATSEEVGRVWHQRFVNALEFHQVECYDNDVVGIMDRSVGGQQNSSGPKQWDHFGGIVFHDIYINGLRLPDGFTITDFPNPASDYIAVRRGIKRDNAIFLMGQFVTGLGDTTSVMKFDNAGNRLGWQYVGASGWYWGLDDGLFALTINAGVFTVRLYDDDLLLTETVTTTNGILTGSLALYILNKVDRSIYGLVLDTYLGVHNTPFLLDIDLDAATWSKTLLDQSGLPGGSLVAYLGTITPVAFRVYDRAILRFWFQKGLYETPAVSWVKGKGYTATVPLADVIEAECQLSGVLSPADIDVTDIANDVRGYRIGTVASIRSALDPLQSAFPFDVVQSGYVVRFVPRGQAPVAHVALDDLGARRAADKAEQRLTTQREMDGQLPSSVQVKYLDPAREYDANEQIAERLSAASVNIKAADIPIVFTADEGAAAAERLINLYWLERYTLGFVLPPSFQRVEPADVLTISGPGGEIEVRLTAVQYHPDGRLECSARYNNAAIYQSTASGDAGQGGDQTIALRGPSEVMLLDIPCVAETIQDQPGFVAAAHGFLSGWAGGVLVRSDDAGQTWATIAAFGPQGATTGYLVTAPGAPQNTALIDAGTAFTARLFGGSLAGVTEAQMLNGANHFAVGKDGRWEIMAARNCVLQADGTYILSDLLRGRFGTEWAVGGHQFGDRIVLLDAVGQDFIGMNSSAIGAARTWRSVTAGESIDSASDVAFTYRGVNLECLSPVYLNGNRHPTTSDWSLSWVRRTRTGGEWRDAVDATLGEASEAYEVEIYSSAAYTTLKRTLTGLSSPAATYTSAQQVTDFGSNQATLYVKIYQLSANVGRGQPLTTSITR